MAPASRMPQPGSAFQDAVRARLGREPGARELAILAELAQAAADAEALELSGDLPPQLGGREELIVAVEGSAEGAWARLRAEGAQPLGFGSGSGETLDAFALGARVAVVERSDEEPIPVFWGVGCRTFSSEPPEAGTPLVRLEGCSAEALGRGAQARALAGLALLPGELPDLVAWAMGAGTGLELELGPGEPSFWGFSPLPADGLEELADRLGPWGISPVPAGRMTGEGRIRLSIEGIAVVDLPVDLDLGSFPAPFEEAPADPRMAEAELPVDLTEDGVERALVQLLRVHPLVDPSEGKLEWGEGQGFLTFRAVTKAHLVGRDPFWGAATAVAEAAQGLACLGAEALGVAVGVPKEASSEVLLGLRQACVSLELPVMALRRLEGLSTPVVIAVGELEPAAGPVDVAAPEARGLTGPGARTCGIGYRRAFDGLFLLGEPRVELGGSRILELRGGNDACPEPWLDEALRLQACVREGVRLGLFRSAHGVGRGGLLIAALQGAAASGLGCQLLLGRAGLRLDALCFGEAPGRVLVTTSGEGESALRTLARTHRVPFAKVGVVGGDRFTVAVDGVPLVDAAMSELRPSRDGDPTRTGP